MRKPWRHFRGPGIGVAVLAGILLSGCDGEDRDRQPAGKAAASAGVARKVDPCAYITPGEVTAITTDAVIRATASGDTCVYEADPDDGVQVTIHAGDGVKQMEVVRRSAKVMAGMGNAVSGKGRTGADVGAMLQEDKSVPPALGDEAMWGVNAILSVRKGDFFVAVTPPVMHDPLNHPGYPLIPRAERRRIALDVVRKILEKNPL
ncbi:MAG: hypothetical protein BGN82_09390 [Alphaproteobacteria bacterium 65-7]|mgnify:CR=1 FL=1|nr:MAG: hypothetical protein BGN82_09390 [Alphaproteobacteria bacterium 65-7]